MTPFITLPGFLGSPADHWQTMWEAQDPGFKRFCPANWNEPDLDDWIVALERAIKQSPSPPILVAHSLSCRLIPFWAARSSQVIAGAFMVGIPDPDNENFPKQAAAFIDMPWDPLRFPALLIASSTDPYAALSYAQGCAKAWGADFTNIGDRGHINAVGDWPQGKQLLQAFTAGIRPPA